MKWRGRASVPFKRCCAPFFFHLISSWKITKLSLLPSFIIFVFQFCDVTMKKWRDFHSTTNNLVPAQTARWQRSSCRKEWQGKRKQWMQCHKAWMTMVLGLVSWTTMILVWSCKNKVTEGQSGGWVMWLESDNKMSEIGSELIIFARSGY